MAEHADIPFWMQNLGLLTAVFWTHVDATLSHNTLPNVFCNHLFAETPLTDRLTVENGTVPVPEGPGLGYEPDFDAIDQFRIDRPPAQPSPKRLIVTEWPDRDPLYFATGNQMCDMAGAGEFPYFQAGVTTRLIPDDGTDQWEQLQQRATEHPVVGDPE